jgi:hypothetical protein
MTDTPDTRLRASLPECAREPARPRDCSRAVWRGLTWTKIKAFNARIENSFVGDLIGCLLLFGLMTAATWLLPLINEVIK